MSHVHHLLAVAPAGADDGPSGIRIRGMRAAITAERSIAGLKIKNCRQKPLTLTLEMMGWDCEGPLNMLAPTLDLIPAPLEIEIAPGAERIVRIGVWAHDHDRERAYRLFVQHESGSLKGHVKSLVVESTPVFVTPVNARAAIVARVQHRAFGSTLHIANAGRARAEICSVIDSTGRAFAAPRYLIAGGAAQIPMPRDVADLHITVCDVDGLMSERRVRLAREMEPAR